MARIVLTTKIKALRKQALGEIEDAMVTYGDDYISMRNQAIACLSVYASKRAGLIDHYCSRLRGKAK
jgi:hypothetical protein